MKPVTSHRVQFRLISPSFSIPCTPSLLLQHVPLPITLTDLAALRHPELAFTPDRADAILGVETEHEQPPPFLSVIDAPSKGCQVNTQIGRASCRERV